MEIATADQIAERHTKNREMITSLGKENLELESKYFFLMYGVKIGSVVKRIIRGEEKLYRVSNFHYTTRLHEKPSVYGNLQKKDGTYSEAQHDLWIDWEVVKGDGS